ncbi:MAG TPA: hypothetical protein VF177_14020, partial [Anaerolineae bacterium]
MAQVQQLYRLQQIDTEIREKKQRLGEVLRAQKEPEALLAARHQAETAAVELQRWQIRHKDLNLELSSLNNKARSSENRLYSGNVRNPKELEDLQKEVESLSRRRSALEDDILEAMIMVEETQAEKAAADEAQAEMEAEWEQRVAGLKAQQNELALRLNTLNGLRQKQVALITPDLLAEYEQLSQRRGG